MQTTLGYAPEAECLEEGFFDHPIVIFAARVADLPDPEEEEAEHGAP